MLLCAFIALTAVASALAIPAFGERGDRRSPVIDFAKGHRLVSAELRSGKHASLWRAPTAEGGHCVFLELAEDRDAAPSDTRSGPGHCAPPAAVQLVPIAAFITWVRAPSVSFNVLVDGKIASTSGIRRIELQSSTASVPLPVQDGYFVGELAAVTSAGSMPSGSNLLIGYNSGGREVARVDLNAMIESLAAS